MKLFHYFYFPIFPFLVLFFFLFVFLFFQLNICFSSDFNFSVTTLNFMYLSIHPSTRLSIHPSIHPFIHPFIYPPISTHFLITHLPHSLTFQTPTHFIYSPNNPPYQPTHPATLLAHKSHHSTHPPISPLHSTTHSVNPSHPPTFYPGLHSQHVDSDSIMGILLDQH